MKPRFILFQRAGVFYSEDTVSHKQQSLRTRDKHAALTLLNAKNESFRQPVLNLQIARAYLTACDPAMANRTWQVVMDEIKTHGRESTQKRYDRAMQASALNSLRDKKLIETHSEDLLPVLKCRQVSVIHFLRRLHNLALALGWIPLPILAPKLWPKLQAKAKRGMTPAEHDLIISAEKNQERRLFYELLWEVGASQSDAAALKAENIDWPTNTLSYFRCKTGKLAQMTVSSRLAALLKQLPATGLLFPTMAKTPVNVRAADFFYLCKRLKIEGVTLHSYRYAWAERARTCGYPERFAQAALGHNSKAVHRAYARGAKVLIPSLEEYEKKMPPKLMVLPSAA